MSRDGAEIRDSDCGRVPLKLLLNLFCERTKIIRTYRLYAIIFKNFFFLLGQLLKGFYTSLQVLLTSASPSSGFSHGRCPRGHGCNGGREFPIESRACTSEVWNIVRIIITYNTIQVRSRICWKNQLQQAPERPAVYGPLAVSITDDGLPLLYRCAFTHYILFSRGSCRVFVSATRPRIVFRRTLFIYRLAVSVIAARDRSGLRFAGCGRATAWTIYNNGRYYYNFVFRQISSWA